MHASTAPMLPTDQIATTLRAHRDILECRHQCAQIQINTVDLTHLSDYLTHLTSYAAKRLDFDRDIIRQAITELYRENYTRVYSEYQARLETNLEGLRSCNPAPFQS